MIGRASLSNPEMMLCVVSSKWIPQGCEAWQAVGRWCGADHETPRDSRVRDIRVPHSHLASLGLNADVVRRDELGLVLPTPLNGRLDTLLSVVHLPLGSTHVSGVRANVLQETLLPRVVLISLREEERLGVLCALDDGSI